MVEVGFFAGLLAAFAFGTFWFYAACVITFFGIMALSENDHEIFSLVVLGAFIFLMEKSGAFNVFADPVVLVKWIGLYFVIGVVWSFIKWFSFVQRKADEYVEHRAAYLKRVHRQDNSAVTNHGQAELRFPELAGVDIGEKTKLPAELKEDFRTYLQTEAYYLSRYANKEDSVIPTALDFKAKITNWIVWWPTSALWTIMSDPMVRIANWIFSHLKGTYQLISNRAFSKFDEI